MTLTKILFILLMFLGNLGAQSLDGRSFQLQNPIPQTNNAVYSFLNGKVFSLSSNHVVGALSTQLEGTYQEKGNKVTMQFQEKEQTYRATWLTPKKVYLTSGKKTLKLVECGTPEDLWFSQYLSVMGYNRPLRGTVSAYQPSSHTCGACAGTGQCKVCGGTGHGLDGSRPCWACNSIGHCAACDGKGLKVF